MVRHSTVSVPQAYSTLGLQTGSSLDNVKSAYKQLALKTHPDKNPDNEEDATEQFQRISEAYNVLLKHLDTSPPRPSAEFGGYPGFGHADDLYYSDEDEYEDFDSDYEQHAMAFYMFLFEEFLRGRASRHSSNAYHRQRHHHNHPYSYARPEESVEAHNARLRQMRQSQEEAEARRAREAANRKAQMQLEREREMRAAAERREQKTSNKKAKAQAEREAAAKNARSQQERLQTLRSAVFAAARRGEIDKVRMGIWEDQVDAAGGEISNGCSDLVKHRPQDPSETLMHIVAKQGNKDMLEWLASHGADPEERDMDGLTAFHISLKYGHIPVIKYFFDAYPPNDAETKSIYGLSAPSSLLSLAVDSHEPEVVWMILDSKLVDQQELANVWARISPISGKTAFLKGSWPSATAPAREDTYDKIRNFIMKFGGFSPSTNRRTEPANGAGSLTVSTSPLHPERHKTPSPSTNEEVHKKSNSTKPHRRSQSTQSSNKHQNNSIPRFNLHPQSRGRGSGRGRSLGRGRGRGGSASSS